ncbi:HNH endonuclease [Methylocystis sp. WRRC1]|uniref:HNH endonuclease signature motif containing protein n=1 Tax=Methylocystis sp. WRRC1 TaxID=1732014 RepID=UPI001D155814|nr:HNH endonuclease [Methylocystis sp. WRRC1]
MGIADRQRFHRKYERKGPDECWPWKAATSGFGYGRFKINGRLYSSHRIAYSLSKGRIPSGGGWHGIEVLHSCDNPACCNPAHLSIGTHAENVADMDAKGRGNRRGSPRKYQVTPDICAKILASGAPATELEKSLGIPMKTINRVRRENGIDNAKFKSFSALRIQPEARR